MGALPAQLEPGTSSQRELREQKGHDTWGKPWSKATRKVWREGTPKCVESVIHQGIEKVRGGKKKIEKNAE